MNEDIYSLNNSNLEPNNNYFDFLFQSDNYLATGDTINPVTANNSLLSSELNFNSAEIKAIDLTKEFDSIIFATSLSPQNSEAELVELTDITGDKFTAFTGKPNYFDSDWQILDQFSHVVTKVESLSGSYTTDKSSSPQLVDFLAISGNGFLPDSLFPQPNITVISPNGGNKLEAGKAFNFTWTDNISENVRLDLYQGSTFKQNITTSTASDGSHVWTVPANLTSGNNYKLKVSSTTNSSVTDWSNNYFTILPKPNITLISPNGGNNLIPGVDHNITWNDNITENVRIDLYKGNSLAKNIIDSTPSDGSYTYNWMDVIAENDLSNNDGFNLTETPIAYGNDYRIKISGSKDGTLFDFSNGYFTVLPKPNITVTSPNDGNQLEAGTAFNFTWTDNISENVRLDLYQGSTFNFSFRTSVCSW